MKSIVFALLTTYALGHRFVINMNEEANQSEVNQVASSI